jgi:hypothetical protein
MGKILRPIERPTTTPKIYTKVVDKGGRAWLYPVDVPNPADHIHVTNSSNWDEAGEGYGGSTLTFVLEDGELFKLRGGWHSNSSSFFSATGVDIRDKHYTRGVIALNWEHHVNPNNYKRYERGTGVKLFEDGWTVSEYSRVKDFALELGEKLKCKLYYYEQSFGGSSSGWIIPTEAK